MKANLVAGTTVKVVLALGISSLPAPLRAQAMNTSGAPRVKMSIDSDWRYRPDGLNLAEKPNMPDSDWQRVSLPHTWNSADPFDDAPSYRRGIGWYRKRLKLPSSLQGKRIFLYFEGVNQVADVYVNGAFVGEHKGGYTGFSFDVTSELRFDGKTNENLVAVKVDNSHNPFIPPLSVGYALYGGIYRDVWLIATDPVHVSMLDNGSSGVRYSTPDLSIKSGYLHVQGTVTNDGTSSRQLRVVTMLLDSRGALAGAQTATVAVGPKTRVVWDDTLPRIEQPHLWSPDDPYLYTARTEVRDGALVLDRIDTPVGFRFYRFDAATGFSLNGRQLVLRGTNRHQDYEGLGSALGDSLHVRDMRWIKDMGANFVRLAHYPQDPAVLAAADCLGLLIWEEIPVVNYITPAPEFQKNSETMLGEMISQHFNHPSVIAWGIMNEVYLWSPQGFRIREQVDAAYMSSVHDFAAHLDSVARSEDATRVTAMAIHGSNDYDKSRLTGITGIVGHNIYSGWYSGVFDDFGKQLDRRHAQHPDEVIFVSEYGAEDDARVNSLEAKRFDFSGTWMRRYHESYLRQMQMRPWLAGAAVWNQFDFSQPETGGSIPYMNQKGLETWDRKPKDAYYLYKANWNPSPMVYIASRGWTRRTGPTIQPVDVYSNLAGVELSANGKSLGVKSPDDVHRATWNVPFVNGKNEIVAKGVGSRMTIDDHMEIAFTYRPPRLVDPTVPFNELGVNAGGSAQYAQPGGPVWEADQTYSAGSFGHTGGESLMFDKDLPIKGSKDTPLFFTYLSGLTAFRFDVPDGEYDVELLFAEPDAKPGERIFSVSANRASIVSNLDLAARYGVARAAIIRAHVSARNGGGIELEFIPTRGKSILNAVRVRKSSK